MILQAKVICPTNDQVSSLTYPERQLQVCQIDSWTLSCAFLTCLLFQKTWSLALRKPHLPLREPSTNMPIKQTRRTDLRLKMKIPRQTGTTSRRSSLGGIKNRPREKIYGE